MSELMSPERLAEIAARAKAATICPEAQVNGREDGLHTWTGSSFTHTQCELCRFTRPRGERAEETIALLAHVAEVTDQRDYWHQQTMFADARLRELEARVAELAAKAGESA